MNKLGSSKNSAFIYDPILKFENINAENSTVVRNGNAIYIGAARPYEAYEIELKSNYDHNKLSKIIAETVPFKFKGAEYFEDGSYKYPTSSYDIRDFSFDLT